MRHLLEGGVYWRVAFIRERRLLEGGVYWRVAFMRERRLKRGNMVKPRYKGNFFLAMAMQFQEIIALPPQGKHCTCSMSCAGNATSSEKLPKYCKLIFWQFMCQQVLPSHRVAGLQFSRAMAAQ